MAKEVVIFHGDTKDTLARFEDLRSFYLFVAAVCRDNTPFGLVDAINMLRVHKHNLGVEVYENGREIPLSEIPKLHGM